jgi:hypothetical protein
LPSIEKYAGIAEYKYLHVDLEICSHAEQWGIEERNYPLLLISFALTVHLAVHQIGDSPKAALWEITPDKSRSRPPAPMTP